MALEFRLQDFVDPLRILRLRSNFQRNCRVSAEALRSYSEKKLAGILHLATTSVPHYRNMGIAVDGDLVASLQRFPILTKADLRQRPESFKSSENSERSWRVSTSGSSGASIDLLMDREANALEFVHYWRHWGWLGYQLGDRFAEFSTVAFLRPGRSRELFRRSRLTNRFTINSTSIDPIRAREIVTFLTKSKPRFIKGLASVLHLFSEVATAPRVRFPSVRAIFSTGETLAPGMRARIQEFFGCSVIDSYGQMERLIAICECEHGSYHVMTDYGYAELLPVEAGADRMSGYSRLVATGLHNRVMPLIRYDTGDWVKGPLKYASCGCGRPFPTVEGILGRVSASAIQISEDAWMPAAFVLADGITGVETLQIIQERIGEVVIQVVAATDEASLRARIQGTLTDRFSPWVKTSVSFVKAESLLRSATGKTPVLVSTQVSSVG